MNHLEKVKQIFDQACDLPANQRAALLDAACAGDGQLRAEVEDLLNAEADEFLSAPLLLLLAKEPEPQSQAGRVIDRYRLLGEIGRGGMATVYLAERIDEYHQQVALKLVWPSANSEEINRRFRQERQILASLDHPNIARLLDGGTTEDGLPFLVMEYIAGAPITHYCRESGISLAERLRLFQTVCAAVAYAHRNLVVHRDIKPGNILVTEDVAVRLPKLLDFGIAKLLAPGLEQQQTVTGLRPMTPEYASPEQLREETMTTSTDIYSLGVLLYELLTGGHPHDLKACPTHEIIRIVCEVDPPPPSARNPQLRGDLDNIVLLALRKEPGQRYQTVEQFSEDISRFLAGEPVSARPSTLRYRAGKYLRRNKTAVIAAAIVLLMLLGMLANEMRRARSFQAEVYERNRQIYSFDMNRAMQAWQDNDLSGMNATLEKYLPKPGAEDWRGFEWRYLWRLAHQDEQTIKVSERMLGGTSLQNDRYIAICGENVTRIFDVETGQERNSLRLSNGQIISNFRENGRIQVLENAHEINTYDLSTDQRVSSFLDDGAPLKRIIRINEQEFITLDDTGLVKVRDQHTNQIQRNFRIPATARLEFTTYPMTSLASVDHRIVTRWDLQTGRSTLSFSEDAEIKMIDFTKKRLLTLLDDQLISLRDLRSGRLIAKIGAGQGGVLSANKSNDERIIATGGLDGSIKLWDAAAGHELAILPTRHRDWVRVLNFSSDGKWMMSASNDRTIKLWDMATWREVVTLKGHASEVDNVGFFADNRRFISFSDIDRTVKIWDLARVLQPTALTGHGDSIYAVGVSPDNRHIATASKDKTAIIWDAVTGVQQVLRGHNDQVFAVAYSPDGQWLATGGNDGTARLWEAASGRLANTFNNLPVQPRYGVSYAVRSVAFTPDGRTLLVGSGEGTIKYWNLADWRLLRTLIAHDIPGKPEHEVVSMRFSPNGKLLATASMEGTAKIWDAANGSLIATLTGHDGYVWAAVFSPDGKLLATCGHDRTVKLWDTLTWREVATLTGHFDEVFSVAFTPDGKRLASASNDDTVRLWDVARRQEVLTIKDNTDQVWSVAFTPDGQTMVTGSWDKSVRLYRTAK